MTTLLKVEGMNCQNCARHVREAIEGISGVKSVRVALDKGEALVSWEDEASLAPVLDALKIAGFPSRPVEQEKSDCCDHDHDHSGAGWKLNVILGSIVTFPLMFAEWFTDLAHTSWFPWASLLVVLPVQVFCGARFYKGAWLQLKAGQSNMDTLVALGSSAAFLFSIYGLFHPEKIHHTYFMEAAAIITLISIGHWLESLASSRAAQAVHQLLNLAPAQTLRLLPNGSEEQVSVADLKTSDSVVLRPGDKVPADGIIIDGSGSVDESMLTGESMPVEKSAGQPLYAGTTNINGRLVCRVQSSGESTALSQIIAAVERSQNSRANIQRLADRISSVFVPIIILCAILTVAGWGLSTGNWEKAIINAISVLIVACPCAMGLATPAAIMAGANAGAKRGILIRDGVALEKTGTITSILFDKTGTLTEGKPQVKEIHVFHGTGKDAFSLAKSLAKSSNHPLSLAIASHPQEAELVEISEWREMQGSGVLARFQGQTVRLGSLPWLESEQVSIPVLPQNLKGSRLGLSSDQTLLAMFSLEDHLKANALQILRHLRKLGLKTYMVSGDRSSVAQSIGNSLEFQSDEIFSDVRPEGKVDVIRNLQSQGKKVAFVGDGINDAPALTQADLGIAVSRANDIAKESSDIVLLKADLSAVPEALQLSRDTLSTIKQNLFWAFFYNVIAVPVAALGFASPILCAAAMGFSDFFLVVNSMRLLYKSPARKI